MFESGSPCDQSAPISENFLWRVTGSGLATKVTRIEKDNSPQTTNRKMKLLLTALCASFMVVPAAFAGADCDKDKGCDKDEATIIAGADCDKKEDCDKDEATLLAGADCDKKKDCDKDSNIINS